MINRIKLIHHEIAENNKYDIKRFGAENAKKVRAYHSSFPEYSVTPLAELKNLAGLLGVGKIFVKDESYRFGLNAFKVLGGSYCVGKYIADKLGIDIEDLSFEKIASDEIREKTGNLTFVTATDGNHGRGIAWTASRLGYDCVVYLPKGSSMERYNNIKMFGADTYITDLNYDDTVRYASAVAEKNGWVLLQDTDWEAYRTIPGWIMEGYTTMACEITEQLAGEKPTHIFLQAGVGAMAAAITGFFSDYYAGNKPVIVIVEPLYHGILSEWFAILSPSKALTGIKQVGSRLIFLKKRLYCLSILLNAFSLYPVKSILLTRTHIWRMPSIESM
jgi:diaminopropionate ammonia-lyase